MYRYYNPNPSRASVGDCAIRAACAATGESWASAYTAIAAMGLTMHDMPSANRVWGAYLRARGFVRRSLPGGVGEDYTVADFAAEHPAGRYVVATSGHVVCVRSGDWLDTWDSGGETPLYYWEA